MREFGFNVVGEFGSIKDIVGPGSVDSEYGKIFANYLIYKGKHYDIKAVFDGGLEIDAEDLFGKHGDEFPLELIR